jgi:O-methyltransferase
MTPAAAAEPHRATPVVDNRVTGFRTFARRLYVRHVRPHVRQPLNRQRLKVVCWDGWGYWRLLTVSALPFATRLSLLRQFLRIDWNVLHAHKPHEISWLCQALSERAAAPGEVIVEAGCWQGGGSAKLSIIGELLGYRLEIFDSFEGVEPRDPAHPRDGYDFSFEYSSPESVLRRHLDQYGRPQVCSIHKGWFADTLARRPLRRSVRLGYIDCDADKGTREALAGIVPALAADGWIFSQDFHIAPVRAFLNNPVSWRALGVDMPAIRSVGPCLAAIRFTPPKAVAS